MVPRFVDKLIDDANGNTASPPPVSVIVATTHGWPELETTLDVLQGQVSATGGEIVVADGNGDGLPPRWQQRYPSVRPLMRPGASVFELRAAAIVEARGSVIAAVEDHTTPAPDWCANVIAAHRANPSAKAVSGAIVNGSVGDSVDWANFLLTFAPFTPPFRSARKHRVPPPVNVSYKQGVLSAREQPAGYIEIEANRMLYERGEMLLDDRIVVAHMQPFSLREACAAHFHNGRATTGLGVLVRYQGVGHLVRRQLRRPLTILRQTYRGARGKPVFKTALRCAPALVLLALCHTAGETVGVLAGPGRSPAELS